MPACPAPRRWHTTARALALTLLAAGVPSARAAEGSTRAAEGSAPPASFVLVVGNNRSQSSLRPDLRYADDDALQYGALYSRTTSRERVLVLTAKDKDTMMAALGPVNGPPTKSMLERAAGELKEAVNAARAAGERTTMTFVFAGHGDVVNGKGVLDLEDARLFPKDLQQTLDAIGADVSHVLLDSCNSFFVMYPRRPGGTVIATSANTTDGIRLKSSALGVFLSTSAEAQVFEWSQLESGIFSHVVRSGLAGAADVDGDGRVRYGELKTFVAIATRELGDTPYRPRLFVRGYDGDDDVLLDLRAATGPRLRLEGIAGHVTIRGARGRRLLDVHPEDGFSPNLMALPVADGEAIEVIVEMKQGGRHVISTQEIAGEVLVATALATVTPSTLAPGGGARGTDAALSALFALPFGPIAAAQEKRRALAEPEEVYGITREQEARLAVQLAVYAERARDQRLAYSSLALGFGAAGAVITVAELTGLTRGPGTELEVGNVSFAALTAAASLSIGAVRILVPTDEERIVASFDAMPHATEKERLARAAVVIDGMGKRVTDAGDARVMLAVLCYPIGVAGVALGGIGLAVGDTPLQRSLAASAIGAGVAGIMATTATLLWDHPAEEYVLAEISGDPDSIFPVIGRAPTE